MGKEVALKLNSSIAMNTAKTEVSSAMANLFVIASAVMTVGGVGVALALFGHIEWMLFASFPLAGLAGLASSFFLSDVPSTVKTIRLLKKNGIKLTLKEKWNLFSDISKCWNFTHELPEKGVSVKFSKDFSRDSERNVQVIELKNSFAKDFNASFHNALTMKSHNAHSVFDSTKYIQVDYVETEISRQVRKLNNRLSDIYPNNKPYRGYELKLTNENELKLDFAKSEMADRFEELKKAHRKDFRRRLAVARENHKNEEMDNGSSLAISAKRG